MSDLKATAAVEDKLPLPRVGPVAAAHGLSSTRSSPDRADGESHNVRPSLPTRRDKSSQVGLSHPRANCTIRSILDHVTPLVDRSRGSVIDLSALTWCEVSGLVGIASIVERARRRGFDIEVIRPDDNNVANYLSTMKLPAVLDELGAHHDLPSVRSRNPGTILALQRFEGADGASGLAEHVFNNLERLDRTVAEALYTGLCEAGENVEEHSGRQGGFIAAQRYLRDGRFQFAVGDSGKGMRKALGMSAGTPHKNAIREALRDGVTGSADRERGNGLPDIARSVARLRGHLLIASGDASVIRRRRPSEVASRTHAGAIRGTVLTGLVRTGRDSE